MLKRFILWDFPRASWQYDVMVGIILVFIFATPREFFRDQPRIPGASQVVLLPSPGNGHPIAWLDPGQLAAVPEESRVTKTTLLLRQKTGDNKVVVGHVEALRDAEGDIQGYLAFAPPLRKR
jgi:hypothetical protein